MKVDQTEKLLNTDLVSFTIRDLDALSLWVNMLGKKHLLLLAAHHWKLETAQTNSKLMGLVGVFAF